MFGIIHRAFYKLRRRQYKDMAPDEIFLDSKNLPQFDIHQMEGRLEKPIAGNVFLIVGIFLICVGAMFISKLWSLQIVHGKEYHEQSINNSLKHEPIIAPRGILYSREGVSLAWNSQTHDDGDFPERRYVEQSGFAHLLGFVKYPARDKSGFYYEEEFVAKDGAELYFNEILGGSNGIRLIETAVDGSIVSESTTERARPGMDVHLSIDSRIQNSLHEYIRSLAQDVGFHGGAGVIMDVASGEILTLTAYPEFDPNVIVTGEDADRISGYFSNPDNPFLNRVVSGLYTPGSIVKPFLAFAALEEDIISPFTEIVSTGKLVVPNPYNPDNPTIFKDWKAHGAVDMRRAIAVSSDVYFYQIGGGFGSQRGLGVARIKEYLERFGFTKKTGFDLSKEATGIIPDPAWKEITFGEAWRIGDTYNTSIGQYGMQVTPIQAVRATAALANGGFLVEPTLLFSATNTPVKGERIQGDDEHMQVAREGMRRSVQEGTAIGLSVPSVQIAGKTGTAELGARKQFVNSWVIGFFPYDKPKYAFAVVMERGPVTNLVGATSVMRRLIDWMTVHTPEYLNNESNSQ